MDGTTSRSLPHTIHHLHTVRKKHGWFRSVGKAFMPSSCSFSSRDAHKEEEEEEEEEGECSKDVINKIKPPDARTAPKQASSLDGDGRDIDGHGDEDNSGGVSPSSAGVDDRSQAIAAATAKAAQAAVAAAEAVAEVVRLAGYRRMSEEETAAVLIQSFYRGYLARKALRALRGLVRLQALVRGHNVRKRAHTTFRCMQTLVRVQAQARARRRLLADEKLRLGRRAGDRKCYRHEYETEEDSEEDVYGSPVRRFMESDGWDGGRRSLQAIRSEAQRRHEAAARRERALAYAFSCQQQWRRRQEEEEEQQRQGNNRQLWGWNWLERWMATQPWQSRIVMSSGGQAEEWVDSHAKVADTDDLPVKTVEMDTAGMVRPDDVRIWRAGCAAATTASRAPSYMTATESTKAKFRAQHVRAGRWVPSTVASSGSLAGCDSSSSGGVSSAYKSLLRNPVPSMASISAFHLPAGRSAAYSPERGVGNGRTPSFASRLWNHHA